MKFFILTFLITLQLFASLTTYNIIPSSFKSSHFMHVNILDAKSLHVNTFLGKSVNELSGITYTKEGVYAVSDKGYLYLFDFSLSHDTIKKFQLIKSYILKSKEGKRLHKQERDSEDVATYYDNLLISFERHQRVVEYSKNGKMIHEVKLNKHLRRQDDYKSKNKGLESVIYSPKYGIITAPEVPLSSFDKKYHTLYARNQHWRFQAHGNITSLEMKDENTILVLLRKFSFMGGRLSALVEVKLDECNEKRICKSQLLFKMDSRDGWDIDNFEGLCKVGKNRYLMISDDNGSFFQKTLLVLFEITN